MRAWPVARSISQCERSERGDNKLDNLQLRRRHLSHAAAKRPEGRAARGRPGNVWQVATSMIARHKKLRHNLILVLHSKNGDAAKKFAKPVYLCARAAQIGTVKSLTQGYAGLTTKKSLRDSLSVKTRNHREGDSTVELFIGLVNKETHFEIFEKYFERLGEKVQCSKL